MENPNQAQTKPMEGTLHCAPPCNGAVCIPRTRYDELLRAENDLGALRRAYQTISIFSMGDIMDIIFDSTLKYKPKDSPETGAEPKESAASAE